MTKENEPEDIEEDSTEEKDGVCAAEALTATFDCDQSEQCNGQIDEQHSVVQCSQRS